MTPDRPSRLQVRAVLDDASRSRRVRELALAAGLCAGLLVAVVAVGLAAGWPVWAVVLTALAPLVLGGFAARTAFVLGRQPGR